MTKKFRDYLKEAENESGLQYYTGVKKHGEEYETEFEFTGDDGETAYGTLYYKVVNGKVDPNSLRGESEYEGNAKVDDEFATMIVRPDGPDHEYAMDAAQD